MTPEQEKLVKECEHDSCEGCAEFCHAGEERAEALCAIIRQQEAWIKRARQIVQAFADHVEDEMIVLWEGLTIDDVNKLLDEQRGE